MKNFFLILLMLLIIAGAGYGVYYQIDNHNKQNNVNYEISNQQYEEGENLDVNDELVTTLMSNFSALNEKLVAGDSLFGYFYQQDSYTVDTISDEAKVLVASKPLYVADSRYNDAAYNTVTISKQQISAEVQKLFGSNVVYNDVNIPNSYCMPGVYDLNTQTYTFTKGNCGGTLIPYIVTKIESAKRYSNKLEIVEKVAYIEPSQGATDLIQNVYKNTVDKTNIGTLEDGADVFAIYGDQLNSHKYTFNYDNGNYYLYAVELVK